MNVPKEIAEKAKRYESLWKETSIIFKELNEWATEHGFNNYKWAIEHGENYYTRVDNFGVVAEPKGEERAYGAYCDLLMDEEDSGDGFYYFPIEESSEYMRVGYRIEKINSNAKAILVMDMPESCSKCKFLYEFQGVKKCHLMNVLNNGASRLSQNTFTSKRHEKCPLRELSEKNEHQSTVIEGTVAGEEEGEKLPAHLKITKVRPIAHHYIQDGTYIKYSCPVCEALGNKHQVYQGEENCPLCNVNLEWEDN